MNKDEAVVNEVVQRKLKSEIDEQKLNNQKILNILKTPRLYDKYKQMMQNHNSEKDGKTYIIEMRKKMEELDPKFSQMDLKEQHVNELQSVVDLTCGKNKIDVESLVNSPIRQSMIKNNNQKWSQQRPSEDPKQHYQTS